MLQTNERSTALIELFLDIGKELLESGAEIYRVEDTMIHLCGAYGMAEVQSFAIRSLILLRARDKNGVMQSGFRRIYSISSNMGKLEELNQLSRFACSEIPETEEISARLRLIRKKQYTAPAVKLAAYMLAPFAFTFFFGGHLPEAVLAAALGALLCFLDRFLAERMMQRIFYTLAASAGLATIAISFGKLFPALETDKTMIAVIMLLVPGMALMNSARDMIDNNPMNGVFSCLDAILTAAAIAAGFAIPMLLLS